MNNNRLQITYRNAANRVVKGVEVPDQRLHSNGYSISSATNITLARLQSGTGYAVVIEAMK